MPKDKTNNSQQSEKPADKDGESALSSTSNNVPPVVESSQNTTSNLPTASVSQPVLVEWLGRSKTPVPIEINVPISIGKIEIKVDSPSENESPRGLVGSIFSSSCWENLTSTIIAKVVETVTPQISSHIIKNLMAPERAIRPENKTVINPEHNVIDGVATVIQSVEKVRPVDFAIDSAAIESKTATLDRAKLEEALNLTNDLKPILDLAISNDNQALIKLLKESPDSSLYKVITQKFSFNQDAEKLKLVKELPDLNTLRQSMAVPLDKNDDVGNRFCENERTFSDFNCLTIGNSATTKALMPS